MSKKKKTEKKAIAKKQAALEETHKKETILEFDTSFWSSNWAKVLVLALVSILIYVRGIDYGYVLDDKIVISDNDFTSAGVSGIWDIFTTESMTGYFGEQKNLVAGNRYRPLSLVTFAAEVELFGKSPRAHHIGNLLWYALCCIVLFRTLYLLLQNRDPSHRKWWSLAFIASMLYAVHPTHVEAVANIKGRDEIMSMLFSCVSIYWAIKFTINKKWWHIAMLAVCYFLGLLSKENTITFLAIVPASMYFFSSAQKGDYVKILGTMLLTTVAYLMLRFSVSGVPDFSREITDIMNNPFYGMTGIQKYSTIAYTLLKYLGLSILPIQLSHDYYPYAIPILNLGDYRALLGIGIHLLMAYVIIRYWRSKSIIAYSLFFYVAALSIVSNIVINVGTFMNERFIFVSTAGVCLLLAYLLRDLLPKWNKNLGTKIGAALLGLLVIGYAVRSYMRVPVWESALTLNTAAVKVSTNSARANSFMATALYNNARKEADPEAKLKMLQEGQMHAEKATSIIPKYKDGNTMKAGIAGELHGIDGNVDALLQSFAEVAVNRPDIEYIGQYLDYIKGSKISNDKLIQFYYDLGYNKLLMQKTNSRWAMHYLSKAYEMNKNDRNVLRAIGDTYKMMGDPQKANQFYQAAGQ